MSENNTRKYLSTGLSCPADGWNFQKDTPKRTHPHRKYLEAIIDRKKAAYQLQILSLASQGINPTIRQLIQTVEKPKPKNEPVKQVFNFLADLVDTFFKLLVYPFSNYSISKFNTLTQKRAMSKEELQKIMDYTLPDGSRLKEARDYFLFSY